MDSHGLSTRGKITATALELFSINGFSTVSVRDIGKAVGIKESSLYYHFKNKEEILRTIFQQAEEEMQRRKNRFNDALSLSPKVSCENFVLAGQAYLEGFLLEPSMMKLIRVLTIEKQRNKDAAALYRQLLFTEPGAHQAKVFSLLMDRQEIPKDNAEAMAAEYQAILLYVFQKHFSGSQAEAPDHTEALTELAALLRRFFVRYFECGEG